MDIFGYLGPWKFPDRILTRKDMFRTILAAFAALFSAVLATWSPANSSGRTLASNPRAASTQRRSRPAPVPMTPPRPLRGTALHRRRPGHHPPGRHPPGHHPPGHHRPGSHRPGSHRPGGHRPGSHRPAALQPTRDPSRPPPGPRSAPTPGRTRRTPLSLANRPARPTAHAGGYAPPAGWTPSSGSCSRTLQPGRDPSRRPLGPPSAPTPRSP